MVRTAPWKTHFTHRGVGLSENHMQQISSLLVRVLVHGVVLCMVHNGLCVFVSSSTLARACSYEMSILWGSEVFSHVKKLKNLARHYKKLLLLFSISFGKESHIQISCWYTSLRYWYMNVNLVSTLCKYVLVACDRYQYRYVSVCLDILTKKKNE